MIDHIGLFVADAAKRADFYEKLLAPLGYVKKAAYPTAVCFANDEDGDGIWLESPKDGNPVVPSHVAFRAKTADAIKAFHEAGLAAGGTDNGKPGPRPNYGPGYYAAFVHDPDGNNIEAMLNDYPACSDGSGRNHACQWLRMLRWSAVDEIIDRAPPVVAGGYAEAIAYEVPGPQPRERIRLGGTACRRCVRRCPADCPAGTGSAPRMTGRRRRWRSRRRRDPVTASSR